MTIVTKNIPASEFKAKCLALLDEVRDERKEIVVTKRGVAVARLVPMAPALPTKAAGGLMKGTVQIHGDLFSTGERWDADADA